MSDYDDMDADELSRKVAQRRKDDGLDRLSDGEWHWPDCPSGIKSRSWSPQPYASRIWACASLLEELDDLDQEPKGCLLKPLGDGRVQSMVAPSPKRGTLTATADTRPEAIARLWLKCDDAGLFDDGDEGDDEPEYTDEELAQSCEYVVTVAPVGRDSIEKLQAAADRLRQTSGATIPQGDETCDECGRPLPSVTWPQIQFNMIHCPCGACYELSNFTWDRVESASYEYDSAHCPWIGQPDQIDTDNDNRRGLTGDKPNEAEVLDQLEAWMEEQIEMYGISRCSNRPSVLATQYENVLDKIDELKGDEDEN